MIRRWLRIIFASLYFAYLISFSATAIRAADTLFYGGDPYDPGPNYLNQFNYSGEDFTQYSQFVVQTGEVWQVSGIFANTIYNDDANLPLNTPLNTMAAYEIRSGISAGNGGVLLASGVTNAVPVSMGYSYSGYDGFRIEANLPSLVSLPAGNYWTSLVPIGDGSNLAFVYLTQGTNGIGTGNQTNYYSSGATMFDPTFVSYSIGILGKVVPEPASVTIIFVALVLAGGVRRVRR